MNLRLLTEDIPDTIWKKNFRMDKITFFELVESLKPMISPDMNSPHYRSLSTEKQIAVILCYLKETGSLWMTANTFSIHQCTIS